MKAAKRSGEGCVFWFLPTKEAVVNLPLFKQLTEQNEPITPPTPRPCSTSPVLISVLHVWHVASLLCACENKGDGEKKTKKTNPLVKSYTVSKSYE